MTPYSDRIQQSHKAHPLAYTSISHLIDGPIAKGGGGGGGRGGGGGGRGGGGGSSGGGSSGGGGHVPPIIFIPGSGSGYRGGSGGSSNSTAPYESSSSKNTGAIVGGVLGGIAALGVVLCGGYSFYKKRQLKRKKVEDDEAQETQQPEQGLALMSPEGGVAPFTLYPPPPEAPAYTPATTTNTTQSEYIAAKSPLEYYKQAPSSSENLVSTSTVIAPDDEKDAQGRTQPTSSQFSSSTLHGIDPLAGAPLSSESRRAYPIPQSASPFTTVGVFDSQSSSPPAVPQATQTKSVFS